MKKIKVTYRQRVILDLLIREGLTQTQIANRLGCTASNINLALKRLMKKYPDLELNINKKTYRTYDIPEKYIKKD